MKLRENRGGHGHVTSYTLSVGSAEARHLGFVDETGERVELEKVLDEKNHQLIIRVKSPEENA